MNNVVGQAVIGSDLYVQKRFANFGATFSRDSTSTCSLRGA